jgi:predicted restriction endonuclease
MGDRPFTVWWQLDHAIPERFHVEFAVPPPQDTPLDSLEPKYQEILAGEADLAEAISSRLAMREFDAPDSWGLVRQRVGGKVFRRQVLENFGGACCVDGINVHDLLDAAHIRAWSKAPESRLDPANGIALCALHHRAFDTGLMHFAPGGRIAIADPVRLSRNEQTVAHLNRFHGEAIRPWVKFPMYLHSTA